MQYEEVEREEATAEEEEAESISKQAAKTALSRMKNGKATEEGRLPAEVCKAGGNQMIRCLTYIQPAYEQEMPDEWQYSVLFPAYMKTVVKKACENCRGITLLTHAGKTLKNNREQTENTGG